MAVCPKQRGPFYSGGKNNRTYDIIWSHGVSVKVQATNIAAVGARGERSLNFETDLQTNKLF